MSRLSQFLWFLAANLLPKSRRSRNVENMPRLHLMKNGFEVKHMNGRSPGLLFLTRNSVHSPDNIFQPLVLQQTKPAEMDWFGEATEETAWQVRAGADRLLWGGVLRVVCYPVTTRDNQVKDENMFKMITAVLLEHLYSLPVFCTDISIICSWRKMFWRGRSRAPLSKPFIWPAWLCKVFIFFILCLAFQVYEYTESEILGLMLCCPCFQII